MQYDSVAAPGPIVAVKVGGMSLGGRGGFFQAAQVRDPGNQIYDPGSVKTFYHPAARPNVCFFRTSRFRRLSRLSGVVGRTHALPGFTPQFLCLFFYFGQFCLGSFFLVVGFPLFVPFVHWHIHRGFHAEKLYLLYPWFAARTAAVFPFLFAPLYRSGIILGLEHLECFVAVNGVVASIACSR
jgi:hypothetical protein